MYRHIIVPLDGSALAETALPHAQSLARAGGSTVTLVRVVAPHSAESGTDGSTVDKLVTREAELYLRDVQYTLQRDVPDVRIRVIVGRDVAHELASAALHAQADLIVMSTHGRTGLRRWVLGSVAESVLHAVSIPVYLVRGGQAVTEDGSPDP